MNDIFPSLPTIQEINSIYSSIIYKSSLELGKYLKTLQW